jgi:MFS family permease
VVVFVDTLFYAVVARSFPPSPTRLDLSKAAAGILAAAIPPARCSGPCPAGRSPRGSGRARRVLGLGLLGISSLVFGFAQDVVLLDVARFFQGVGGACSWTGGLAWLVADAPPDRRGRAHRHRRSGRRSAARCFGPVLGALAESTSRELVFGSVLLVAAGLAAWALATPSVHEPDRQDASVVAAALRTLPSSSGCGS